MQHHSALKDAVALPEDRAPETHSKRTVPRIAHRGPGAVVKKRGKARLARSIAGATVVSVRLRNRRVQVRGAARMETSRTHMDTGGFRGLALRCAVLQTCPEGF
jgi:hypothetical protein